MTDTVRAERGAPVSHQIAVEIRERIASGELRAGDTIPSTQDIVARWGVARMTAHKAVTRLKSEGLIVQEVGRGLVVRARQAGVSPASQLARAHATGKIRLPNERTQVLQTGMQACDRVDPSILAAVGLTEQSPPALYRRRLILRDDKPLCVATSWVADGVLCKQPGWDAVRERLLSYDRIIGGTAALIAAAVDEDVEREDYVASAEPAAVMEADLLNALPGAPVLQIVSTVHGQSWPLECGVYTYAAGVAANFPSAEFRH